MKEKLLCFAILLLSALSSGAAEQCLYLSSGDTLSVFTIDAESGELNPLQEIGLPGTGPMGPSPDGRALYVNAAMPGAAKGGQQASSPGIATFEVEAGGKLSQAHLAPVNLASGYLRADATGRFLAGNHYGPGMVTLWKVDSEGIYRGETVQEVELEPKAHCAVFSPDNRFLLVPATGPNKVFQLTFDAATGRAAPNDPPFAEAPQSDGEARQPRHLIFHPNGKIVYTTLERERPGVGVWAWDEEKGTLKVIQNIVTQPEGFDGVITTADLNLTPDAKFLYISNRDTTERQSRSGNDSIVGFSVDAGTGALTLIGHTACEHVPRSFRIDDTGRFLYVAGQGDDKLGVYRIDSKTGALTKVTQYDTGARPIWVHCMAAP